MSINKEIIILKHRENSLLVIRFIKEIIDLIIILINNIKNIINKNISFKLTFQKI